MAFNDDFSPEEQATLDAMRAEAETAAIAAFHEDEAISRLAHQWEEEPVDLYGGDRPDLDFWE